jgi:hypothetical protein
LIDLPDLPGFSIQAEMGASDLLPQSSINLMEILLAE